MILSAPFENVHWHMGKFMRVYSDGEDGGQKKSAPKKDPTCCATEYFSKCSSVDQPMREFYKCERCSRQVCTRCIQISLLLKKDME